MAEPPLSNHSPRHRPSSLCFTTPPQPLLARPDPPRGLPSSLSSPPSPSTPPSPAKPSASTDLPLPAGGVALLGVGEAHGRPLHRPVRAVAEEEHRSRRTPTHPPRNPRSPSVCVVANRLPAEPIQRLRHTRGEPTSLLDTLAFTVVSWPRRALRRAPSVRRRRVRLLVPAARSSPI